MKIKASLALLLVFCVLLPALAQTKPTTPSAPQKPSDEKDEVVRITTNLVQIDAVVTKDGKPVPNLTAEDFEIFEDGKRQPITSFAYVSNVANVPSEQPVDAREKPADVVPFSPVKRDVPRRTIALVVDDLGLSAESMGQVRRQLRKFVAEELQPNDLVAIMRTGGQLGALQQFTTDRRLLNRAVEVLHWNFCSRVGIQVFPSPGIGDHNDMNHCGGRSYEKTQKALRFILDAMRELPGRKSMILFSDSMPIESQEINIRRGSTTEAAQSPLPEGLRDTFNYANALNKIAEKAIRASVVIYSIDTQGLAYTGITAADSLRGNSRSITTQINALMSSRSALLRGRREGGEMLARQTGGFQVRNSNSFRLERIMEDQGGYYLLGYRPSEETFNKEFHRIKAKVKGSGLTLRTRFGFYGITEEEAKRVALSPRDETNLALASPFSKQDIELDLTSFFVNDNAAGSLVRTFVYLDARNLQLAKVNDRHEGVFDLHGVLFGDNGSVVEQVQRVANLSLSDDSYQRAIQNGVRVSFDMPIKRPGAYQVRVAARDRNSSHIGSGGDFVAVPNLGNKRMAASGIVLANVDGPTGDANPLVSNPGTRRFQVNSDLYFTYMVYNAADDGRSQSRDLVREERLFHEGKVVYLSPEKPIAASQADPNRVLVNGVVRLAPDLEPGVYYLRVVITDKSAKKKTAPVVQWVDFEVTK